MPSVSAMSSSGSARPWTTSQMRGSTAGRPRCALQAPVGHDVDARDLCAAEVERHPVRLAVIERGEQSLA